MVNLEPTTSVGLVETLDLILDKGIVVDSKLRLYLGKLKLLGIRAIVTLAAFESAIRIDRELERAGLSLKFPGDVDFDAPGWKTLAKEPCSQCGRRLPKKELKAGCPWCGFRDI